LRTIVAEDKNDLFFVGDGHQRIYGRNKAALGRCGIDIRGRARKLYVNYRTTDEIRKAALAYLEGCEIDDLDDGNDESQRYKSLSRGPVPQVGNFESLNEAQPCLLKWVEELSQRDSARWTTCVIAATKKLRDAAKELLGQVISKSVTIEANEVCEAVPGALYFSTMHRAKGLEFDQVIVICRKEQLVGDNDDARKLIYVALTRARRESRVVLI